MVSLSGYKLTFDDEFNSLSAGLPGTPGIKWETEPFYRDTSNGGQGTINPTPPGQAGSLYSVSNGILNMRITSNSAPYLDTNPNGVPGGFSQKYGYFEMRAKLTDVSGYSDAFWLMPNSGPWPPEMDIEEHNGDYNTLSMTNHGGTSSTPAQYRDIYNEPNLAYAFHTYGFKWTPTTLTWYLDGQQTFSCPTASNEQQPFNVILSAYANHGLGYLPDAKAGTSDHMQVDWVHVYSNDPNKAAIAGQPGYQNHDGSVSAGQAQASAAPVPDPAPVPVPVPATHPIDNLVLHLSEDAWNGNAKFIATMDGRQLGAAQYVTALHSSGSVQDFAFSGDFGDGRHDLGITFLNDSYGGTARTDRNLYVNSIDYNSAHQSGAAIYSNGTHHFSVYG